MKFDLFGIQKRKEALHIKEEQKFTIIKKEYQILKERANKEASDYNNIHKKRLDDYNNTCPHCKSTNVNDRIKRIQGDFGGSISGSMFGFSEYGSGKIDTNEVNKCNDCNNEWKKRQIKYTYDHDLFKLYFQRITCLCQEYKQAVTAKVNKNDLNEKFNSDEEKRNTLLESFKNHVYFETLKKFFNGISIETIEYLSKQKETWLIYFRDIDDDYDATKFKKSYDAKILEEYLGLKHINLINTSEI